MGNKKRNTIITIIIFSVIIIAGIIAYILNYSHNNSSLTILEKKWITNHTNKIVDINIYNDIPIYGYNGNGIIFDYLNYFTEKHGINFNKISYFTKEEIESKDLAFITLSNEEEVTENDILFYEDHYVILKKNLNKHINLNDIDKLGLLSEDITRIKTYLGNDNISYLEYKDIDALIKAYNNDEVNYLIIPNVRYMDDILKNNFNIVYHINDLHMKYVLRVKDKETYNIFYKIYHEYYKEEYRDDYSNNYLNVYFNNTNTSDLERKNYNAKTYKYGYVINMPFENYVNKEFVGTISNYLKTFEQDTQTEIEVIRYDKIDDLKSALVSGEVDFSLANFNYDKLNMEEYITNTITDMTYVVLSKNELVINSLKGLSNKKVLIVNESKIHELCSMNNILTIEKFNNTDELLRNIDDESILLIDKETYLYYKNNKLKDYKIAYEETLSNGYKFIMNKSNETFNQLFDYYISSINYNLYRYEYNTEITLEKDLTMYKILAFIAGLLMILTGIILFVNKKNVTNNVISKEDKLKYIDPMTSLKNRNYLNANIYKWDDNVIFPQSVVVFDINNVRDVNDKLGREAGDEIIKKVASILINNQLENTDIIRSGGDEFLIYMIGYEEKKVAEYTKNILKEMKNIPNTLGVEYGYSMILDEVKTVDDAINEAITMMNKNKEKRNK